MNWVLFISIDASWEFTFMERNSSLSSRILNITEIGLALLCLYLPTLLQPVISTFFAVSKSACLSPELIVVAIISYTLSLVVWYGSKGPSCIPVMIIFLLNCVASTFVSLSRSSLFSVCRFWFSMAIFVSCNELDSILDTRSTLLYLPALK